MNELPFVDEVVVAGVIALPLTTKPQVCELSSSFPRALIVIAAPAGIVLPSFRVTVTSSLALSNTRP